MRFRLVENLLLEYKTKTNPFSGVLGNDEFQEVFKKISKGTSLNKNRYINTLQELMDKYFPNANAENVKAVIHSIVHNNAYNINTAPLWEWMLNAPKIRDANAKIDKLDTLNGKNVYDFNQPWFKNINLWKKPTDDFVYVVNVFTMFQSPDKLKRIFNDKFIKNNAKALSLSHLFAGVKIDPNTGLPSKEIPEAKYETQKIKDTDKIKYVIDVLDKLADSQDGRNKEDEKNEKDKDKSSKSDKKSSGEHYKDVADRFTKLKNVLTNLKNPTNSGESKQEYAFQLDNRYITGNDRDRQRGIYSYNDLIEIAEFSDKKLKDKLKSAYSDVSSKLRQGKVDLKPILSAIELAIKFAEQEVKLDRFNK